MFHFLYLLYIYNQDLSNTNLQFEFLNWQLEWVVTHQKPSKKVIEREWFNFFELVEKGKKYGIADGHFFYEQGRTLIEAFKFFDDIVPELKQLK